MKAFNHQSVRYKSARTRWYANTGNYTDSKNSKPSAKMYAIKMRTAMQDDSHTAEIEDEKIKREREWMTGC